MYIPQQQLRNLQALITPGKVVVIYGARRVGKTTLVRKFLKTVDEDGLYVDGDDIIVRQNLESQSVPKLRDFVGDSSLLIVDEAQRIKNIGVNLKLIVDHIPNIKVIATASSSFDIAKDIGEPLTGRKYVLQLFPLAQMEISMMETSHETQANLESRLLYGSYPEAVTTQDNIKREGYLRELVASYLFKDILELEGVRHSDKLVRLLQLLAFQIGRDVSHNELGTQLRMSKNTVDRYLDLLEKVFVIYGRSGFSRNLRKEITKNRRYYFYDNGIRNALIGNFNPIEIRDDLGRLWENYVIIERKKKMEYSRQSTHSYFWRTYDRKEIDLIEERAGKLFGYEIKWQKRRVKPPKDWLMTYNNSSFEVIDRGNYLTFIQ
ncbi:MAG: ATP-binding protein [Candidatus Neomarinimicrobiota bacterium]